jgi:hypothetical protein
MEKYQGSLGVAVTGGLEEVVTPWAGAGLLVETYRRSGVAEAARQALPGKRSSKGLTQEQMVESFILLSALGGDCVEDMQTLRQDEGLEAMLGYCPPAPETARQWLDRFHDEALMNGRDDSAQRSFLPAESGFLAALREPNRQVIKTYVDRVAPGGELTLDVDASLVESQKASARYCYEGWRALQSLVVEWAETGLVLADEFRDGNVPAGRGIKEIVDGACDMLPPGNWRVRIRSDTAAYQQYVLEYWDGRGWQFAVSADMSQALRRQIEALPEDAWKAWEQEKKGMVREYAEVPYVPSQKYERKDGKPYRYVAVRVRRQQGELFEDGTVVRHFAVVSNIWDMDGKELLDWQRGKAGTVEHLHHVLGNELAAGVYPSARHGANAAWLRLQVLTHNLLELMKRLTLPPEYRNARPKRLRFAVFTHFGRVVSHAGQMLLKIASMAWEKLLRLAYRRVLALGPCG